MFKRISLFTGAVLIVVSASLLVSCKKKSSDDNTPTTTTPTTPAAASIKATIDGTAWTATHMYAYKGSNSTIVSGGSSSPADSIYMGMVGTPMLGTQNSTYCDLWISGTHYTSSGFNGFLTVTDTANKKMTGTFHFTTTSPASKSVVNGTFTNVPF